MIQLEEYELDDFEMQNEDEEPLLVRQSPKMGRKQYEGTFSDTKVSDGADYSEKETRTPWFIYVLSFFSAIGGFLFGYDTGVVSGAMLLLKNRFHLSSLLEEVIVSVTIGFACLFALCGGVLNDRFGRKFTTILASFVFTIGAAVLAAAVNVEMLIGGRAILGIGIGNATLLFHFMLSLLHENHWLLNNNKWENILSI